MNFKDSPSDFHIIDITLIDPDPAHPRKHSDDAGLKGLANSIKQKGLIHPLIVQAADAAGRHRLIVGERRWRAALIAGETKLPVLIRNCSATEALEVQVFENLGLGLRAPLEPREMALAIQAIAERFASEQAAAEHFGRTPTWLNQATAAAKLSPKVSALLDAGKISGTTTAVQLERLSQKNEVKADSLIDQTESLPEGEKLSRKAVDSALAQEGGRRSKKKEETPASIDHDFTPPWEDQPSSQRRVNSDKFKRVAEILGLPGGNEDEVLERLIDEFLAINQGNNPPF